MRCLFEDASSLPKLFSPVSRIIEEGTFEFKEDGIRLRAMDPSQISMISFYLPSTNFLAYKVEKPIRVTLDISALISVLKRAKRGEKAEIAVEENEFVVKFFTEKRKREFRLPTLAGGEVMEKEPNIDFTAKAVLVSSALKDVIKDVSVISSYVKMGIKKGVFYVTSGGELGKVNAEFEEGGEDAKEIESSSEETATFPLQYLEDILRDCPKDEFVIVYLATNKPLKLEYNVMGAKITFYLAPRIEET